MMAGDKHYTSLCNINWHLLSLSDQKSISLMMVFAIQPKPITMILKVLNVESFLKVRLHSYSAGLSKFPVIVQIYQAIYSYLMVLMSFT